MGTKPKMRTTAASGLKTDFPGGGCGCLHRKNQENIEKKECKVWRRCDDIHASYHGIGFRAATL